MSGAPTFGPELLKLDPNEIDDSERLGLFFPDKAAALGHMMEVDGHRTPITVRRSGPRAKLKWKLVVGKHRLAGAKLKSLPFVYALERIGGSENDARDEESSENLDRRDQPPLERAIFIFHTAEAAKARLVTEHGDTKQQQLAAKARWNRVKSGALRAEQALQEEADDACDTMSHAYGWIESVAAAFGRDKRAIYRALSLYRLIVEPFGQELTQALSDHPVVGNNASELKRIAEVRDEDQRRAVIDALLADAELGADAARVLVGIDVESSGPKPLPQEKFFSQIDGGWSRLNTTQKREYLPRLVQLLTPDMRRRLRELIDATEQEEDATFADSPLTLPSMRHAQR